MWSAYDLVMLLAALVAALLLLADVRDEALRACKPFLLRLLENAGALTKEEYTTRANMAHSEAAAAAAHHDALRGASAAGAFARGVAAEQSQAHAQPPLSAGAWGERTAPPLSIVAPVPQVSSSASPPTGSSYGTPAPVPSPTSATASAPSTASAAATPTASPSPSIEATAAAAVANAAPSGASSTKSRSGSGVGSTLSPPTATEAAAAAERKRRHSAKGTAASVSNTGAPSAARSQSSSSSSAAPLDVDRDETEANSQAQREVSRSSGSRSVSRKQALPQAQAQQSQPTAVATGAWPPPPPPMQNAGVAAAAAPSLPAVAVAPLAAGPISVVVPVTPLPAIVAAALTAQTPIPSATAPAMPAPLNVAAAEPLDISLTAPHDGQGREVSVSRRGPGGIGGGGGVGAGENAYVAWLAAQQAAQAAPLSSQQPVPLIAGHPLTSLTVLRSTDCGVPVEEYFTPTGEKIAWRRGNIWDRSASSHAHSLTAFLFYFFLLRGHFFCVLLMNNFFELDRRPARQAT